MIEESYVSFDTAKLLKEAGFIEHCRCMYFPDKDGSHKICQNIIADYNVTDDEKYEAGDVVAVAQSYEAIWQENASAYHNPYFLKGLPGWKNKMFVDARDMPHQICITDVRVDRIQDISDECCLKEGIIKKWHAPACKNYYYVPGIEVKSVKDVHDTPQEAFAHLINKVSRKDVCQENPYVFVYDFELVK